MNRPSYGYSAQDSPDPQGQPVCPRHPDRVSYVRCKRCDRPACPECQRPTQVGMLCADCDRELARQQASTRPRNAMGGGTTGKPVITYTVMALCLITYIGQIAAPDNLVERLGWFVPLLAPEMPWTFLTAGFLHGGIVHLAANMWALWAVGQALERAMGHARFAAVYFASIFAGHTAVYLLTGPTTESWLTPTVGASGGVFGLFAAMFVISRRMGAEMAQILFLIVLNLVITFTVPGISWQGHLGGLVVGGLLTAGMFALRPKAAPGADRQALAKRSALIHAGLVAAAVLLCLLLVIARYVTLPY